MERSQTAAIILGPGLAMIALVAVYWFHAPQHPGTASPALAGTSAKPPAASETPLASAAGADNFEKASAPSPLVSDPLKLKLSKLSPAEPPFEESPPKFDVVRVEPNGDWVVAGHTLPDMPVAVMSNGKAIADGKSDAFGQFVLLPPSLLPGNYELILRIRPPGRAAIFSEQNVSVSVPRQGQGEVMAALTEPGKATVLLADPAGQADQQVSVPGATKVETASLKSHLAIKTAEIIDPDGFFASGSAASGDHVRLYLNGSFLAEITAGVGGQWSVKIEKGLVPGHYSVRADQIGGSGTVTARAEVPFDYSGAQALKPANAEPILSGAAIALAKERMEPAGKGVSGSISSGQAKIASAGPAISASGETAPDAVVAEIQTAKVEAGRSLWRISRQKLGEGSRYTEIYAANSAQIRDPDLIYPGQVFVVPAK